METMRSRLKTTRQQQQQENVCSCHNFHKPSVWQFVSTHTEAHTHTHRERDIIKILVAYFRCHYFCGADTANNAAHDCCKRCVWVIIMMPQALTHHTHRQPLKHTHTYAHMPRMLSNIFGQCVNYFRQLCQSRRRSREEQWRGRCKHNEKSPKFCSERGAEMYATLFLLLTPFRHPPPALINTSIWQVAQKLVAF